MVEKIILMANFQKAFDFLMANEGGWSNNKNDKGGATKFGITKRTYSSFIGHEASDGEIFCLTKELAQNVYRHMFWDIMHLDGINSDSVACALFDQGVNRGPQTVIKDAQRILGCSQDGINGPGTTNAINHEDSNELIRNIASGAIYAYKKICEKDPTQLIFLNGWTNRANKLLELIV